MKKISLILIILLLCLPGLVQAQENIIYHTEKARVVELGPSHKVEDNFYEAVEKVKLQILSGSKKGQIYEVDNTLGDNPAYNINIKPGDKLAVIIESNRITGQEEIHISDYYRLDSLGLLILLFVGLVILVGGRQGLRAIVSLGLTVLSIGYILLPGLLKGHSPIGLSILVSLGITIVTILIITGFTTKSLAAIVGTGLGVIIAGSIAYLLGRNASLTGLSADDATMLLYIPQGIEFNLQELLFAGIILGSLGAVMDVGMSIASSLEEISLAKPSLNVKELIGSGMNIGRDIMGTMVNTLILAYTGSSLPILLLFLAYDGTLREIMNLDMLATEIVRSVSGSMGLILTIPITSLVASLLINRFNREKNYEDTKEDMEENIY